MMPFVGPPEPESPLAAHLSRQAAQEGERGLGAGWKYGPAAASLFDALATRDAINRGGSEANPIMAPFAENDLALIGTKVGSGLLAGYLASKLHDSGHKTAAKIVSGINVAVPLGAGIHNLRGGRK
jgi:hypothetical protein